MASIVFASLIGVLVLVNSHTATVVPRKCFIFVIEQMPLSKLYDGFLNLGSSSSLLLMKKLFGIVVCSTYFIAAVLSEMYTEKNENDCCLVMHNVNSVL